MMGNTNMDMTRSKIFNAAVYTCAAAGALAGAIGYGGGTAGGILLMGAGGAIAGGIGFPLALTAVAAVGYVSYVGTTSMFKALKSEGAAIPLGLALVGFSAAKALFVDPVKKLRGIIHAARKPAATEPASAHISSAQTDAEIEATTAPHKPGRLKSVFSRMSRALPQHTHDRRAKAAPKSPPPPAP